MQDFYKYKIGICWDFVNYQHSMFKKFKINDESYMIIIQKSDKDNDIITHTFSIIDIDNDKYWFESSMGGNKGLHKIKSYRDVVNIIVSKYNKMDKPHYDVYKYDPSGLDNKLSNDQFFKKTTRNLIYNK